MPHSGSGLPRRSSTRTASRSRFTVLAVVPAARLAHHALRFPSRHPPTRRVQHLPVAGGAVAGTFPPRQLQVQLRFPFGECVVQRFLVAAAVLGREVVVVVVAHYTVPCVGVPPARS